MKRLKIFENYQTEEEVAKICKRYGIENWSINKDGLVDVAGHVNLSYKGLTKSPLKFGIISGEFDCSNNYLTTLEGAPQSVGNFSCFSNYLTTLEGAPQSVGESFYCHSNNLTTLKGAPESVVGDFWCHNNRLTTLEGAPYSIDGYFGFNGNPLLDLIKRNNMKSIKHILANQEMYHIYNKDGSINEYRFRLMMDSMD